MDSRALSRIAWHDIGRPKGGRATRDSVRYTRRHVIELGAIINNHAGDFHGNRGSGGSTQLANARRLRQRWRAFEALREQTLNLITQFFAQR